MGKRYKYYLLLLLPMLILKSFGGDYTVSELAEKAEANDNLKTVLEAEISKSVLLQKSVKASYYPSTDLVSTYSYQSDLPKLQISGLPIPVPETELGIKNRYDAYFEIKQLIFNGFATKYRAAAIQEGIGEQQFRLRFRQKEIAHMILQFGYRYHLAELSEQVLASSYQRISYNLDRVRLLFDKGYKSALDTLEIAVKLDEIELQKIELLSYKERLLQKLEIYCGVNDIEAVIIPDDLLDIKLCDPQKIRALSPEGSFEVKLTDYQARQIRLREKEHRAAYYPQIYGFASYHYGKPGIDFMGDEWMQYTLAGISLRFNLWNNFRDRNRIGIDRLSLRQLEERKAMTLKDKKIKVNDSLRRLDELKSKIGVAEQILAGKRSKYELTKKQWEAGKKSTIDVLLAEEELTTASLNKQKFIIEYLSLYQNIKQELNVFSLQ